MSDESTHRPPRTMCAIKRPAAAFYAIDTDRLHDEADHTLRFNRHAHRLHARDAELGWDRHEFYALPTSNASMRRLSDAEVAAITTKGKRPMRPAPRSRWVAEAVKAMIVGEGDLAWWGQ